MSLRASLSQQLEHIDQLVPGPPLAIDDLELSGTASFASAVLGTGFGKRSAFVDLDTAAGRATFAKLTDSADVWIDAYRPDSFANRGFDHAGPGSVTVQISAFDWSGLGRPTRLRFNRAVDDGNRRRWKRRGKHVGSHTASGPTPRLRHGVPRQLHGQEAR